MPRVKALNTNGEVTWCTAKVPGHGNCNHIFHQTEGISDKRFQQEVDEYNEKMAKLLNSDFWFDRLECARRGYGLDKLVHDEDSEVRAEVAKQGYGHDILVNDPDKYVRGEVASQGSYLDILTHDKDEMVRYLAEEKLKELEESKKN